MNHPVKIFAIFIIVLLLIFVAFDRLLIPGIEQTMERTTITKSDLELLQHRNLNLGKTIGRSAMMEWWAKHSETSVTIDMKEYLKYEDQRAKEITAEQKY